MGPASDIAVVYHVDIEPRRAETLDALPQRLIHIFNDLRPEHAMTRPGRNGFPAEGKPIFAPSIP